MSQIAFGKRTITATGTPQPLVGTTLSAAVAPTNASKGSPTTPPGTLAVNLPVADSSIFAVGDRVWVGTGSTAERPRVTDVPDSTHVTVDSLQNAHASGVFVIISTEITSLYVQEIDGNAAALVLYYNPYAFGEMPSYGRNAQSPDTTNLTQAVAVLEPATSPAQPEDFSSSNNFGANPDNLSFWWISGTAGDAYLPTAGQT